MNDKLFALLVATLCACLVDGDVKKLLDRLDTLNYISKEDEKKDE